MYLIPLLLSIFYLQIGNRVTQSNQDGNPILVNQTSGIIDSEGLLLLKKHCYACHNPNTATHDEIIAPPLEGIKSHYLKAYPEKGQFTEAMLSFVLNPQVEKALMKGPITRFGLMPKPAVSKDELNTIITYIRDQKLEVPSWWADHIIGGKK